MTASFHRGARLGLVILASATLSWKTPAAGDAERPQPGEDLFRAGSIPRLRIELAPAAMASLRENPRQFVAATVSDGSAVYSQVAVHLKGATGSFRPLDDKPGLTLDFSRFQAGRKFRGLRRIHLNNSVEDPSYLNEKLGGEFFQSAGMPAPRVTRALVALNDGPPRLYVLKEGFTEDFLARHFEHVGGELYEPGVGHDVDEKLSRNSVSAPFDPGQSALKRLSAAAQEPDPARRWQALEATLDTKRFLGFMAAEVMLGHRDGYSLNRNNFRVYHDLDSGKIVFFPHGMDQLLGTAELPWQPNWAGLVARAVMNTPGGSQRYAATFGSLLTNQFNVERLTGRVDELVAELRPAITKDEFAKVCAAAALVKERIANRKSSLLAQLNRPALRPLEFAADGGRPEGWETADRPAGGTIDQADLDGRPTLHISTRSESLAAWKTTVLLPRGRYRFADRVRVAGVEPLPFAAHPGARLRVGGNPRETASLTGDSSWRELAADFEVEQPMAKVELICELRARAGDAWFDLPALRVLRIDNAHEN